MPRDYAPMNVDACIQAARNDAYNHWGGVGGYHPCGNQGTEYTTLDRRDSVKNRWLNLGTLRVNGVNYNTRASDSQSAVGLEIDLKLAAQGANDSEFNYHIVIDSQRVARQPPPNLDKLKDAYRMMNNMRREEYRDRHNGIDGYIDIPFPTGYGS